MRAPAPANLAPAAPAGGRNQPLLSGIRPCPVLASDALREDVAPLQPAPAMARILCVGAAVVLFASLLVSLEGPTAHFGWSEFLAHVSTGGARLQTMEAMGGLLLLALLPIPYAARAFGLVALGTTAVVEGCFGEGPLGALLLWPTNGYPWELARLVAATTVPAALLFRARYRAYPMARLLLAAALVLALPFAWHTGFLLMTSTDLWIRMESLGILLALAASLGGFMGAGTTAMGGTCAVALILFLTAHVLTQSLPEPVLWLDATRWQRALPFLSVSSLLAVGLFQILATLLARDARKVNVFRVVDN